MCCTLHTLRTHHTTPHYAHTTLHTLYALHNTTRSTQHNTLYTTHHALHNTTRSTRTSSTPSKRSKHTTRSRQTTQHTHYTTRSTHTTQTTQHALHRKHTTLHTLHRLCTLHYTQHTLHYTHFQARVCRTRYTAIISYKEAQSSPFAICSSWTVSTISSNRTNECYRLNLSYIQDGLQILSNSVGNEQHCELERKLFEKCIN